MHDKFRKKYRVASASEKLRRQIALEAARRMLDGAGPAETLTTLEWLEQAGENDFYTAKRKAAAVLGHRVRPGDLPSDGEVRDQIVTLWRSRQTQGEEPEEPPMPEPGEDEAVAKLGDHLDRFALYRLRLVPLEAIKQNPKYHPEGDALYHSLQVFHLARDARPYDEEFLLAALLHDVGKALDPQDHCAAGAEALRGAVTERTLWLIEHHMDLMPSRERSIDRAGPPRARGLGVPRRSQAAARAGRCGSGCRRERRYARRSARISQGPGTRRLPRRLSGTGRHASHPGQTPSAISATFCRSSRLAPPAACTDMPWINVATNRASAAGSESAGRSPSALRPLETLAETPPRSRSRRETSSRRMEPAASPHASAALDHQASPRVPRVRHEVDRAHEEPLHNRPRGRLPNGLAHVARRSLRVAIHHLPEEGFLVPEGGVKAGPVDAHGPGQLRERRSLVPSLPEDLQRRSSASSTSNARGLPTAMPFPFLTSWYKKRLDAATGAA